MTVTKKELEEVITPHSFNVPPDLVALGCPHLSLPQLSYIAKRLEGRRVQRRFWVCTSKSVYSQAERLGYVKMIEKAGGVVVRDTCMVVSPIGAIGIRSVLTDSYKANHYLPSTNKVKVGLKGLDECIQEALT